MEFVVGVTVEELIDEHEKLKVIEALRITENVLQALKYAHEKKFIHRDIKPSNMMRNELGVVKVMDFGLAKSTESQGKTTIIAGTPSYMPPEQFTGKGMDARSDIFAVGASLYEMLAGYPPFEGMDRSKEPEPIQQINPAVPKLLGRLIHRSIELDKEKRIQNADEMLKPIGMILSTVQDFMKKGG